MELKRTFVANDIDTLLNKRSNKMELERTKEQVANIEPKVKKQMDDDGIKQAISPDTATKESVAYITNLLKKRKWTGEEAGKVLIYNLIKNLGRKPSDQEASKWKDIHPIYYKRLEKLTETGVRIHAEYCRIHRWLLRADAIATLYQQFFTNGFVQIGETANVTGLAELISYRTMEIYHEIDPILRFLLGKLNLDKFITENEREAKNIKSARTNLLKGFYFTRGYCKAIELIADYLKIDTLNIFKMGIKSLYESMLTLNIAMEKIGSITNNHATGDEKVKKLEILKQIFEPIEITWKISENTIAKAQDQLIKKQVFINDALYFIEPFTIQEKP